MQPAEGISIYMYAYYLLLSGSVFTLLILFALLALTHAIYAIINHFKLLVRSHYLIFNQS